MFTRRFLSELLVGLLLACSLANAGQSAQVETTAGPVKGVVNATTVFYLGIPYAEPPIGELRWQPPRPKRPWKAVLDATNYRDHCVQFPLNKELVKDQTHANEDCLFLNVFAPRAQGAKDKRLKPVMVSIHGGANVIGWSDFTDPTPLIETGDVVVVSMNYRLGPFGFMAHPALDAEGHPFANYGVMDQQLALKWVRDNIARFGGDPRNVTIFGVSAGGLNVTTHLISPASAGLFHRAIIQSGGYMLDTPSLSYAQGLGAAFAKRVGCAKQAAAETAACLRALSAADMLTHLSTLLAEDNPPRIDKFLRPGGAYPQMTVDGQILPETHRAALSAGRFHRVPVMLGSTSDEEKEFSCGALDSQRSLSKWVPTYVYEFADPAASPKGATHGADVRYLFNHGGVRDKPEATTGPFMLAPESRALSEAMRLSWTAFAASGNPSTVRIPKWPRGPHWIQRLHPKLSVVSAEDFSARYKCASDAAEPSPRVETAAGPVRGSVHPTSISYRGIPYAEPPLGQLRWRPPEPRRTWTAVLDATKYRPHCLQSSLSTDQTNASEDCLFLNVYLPRKKIDRPLPVMVWIHGGANIGGASDSTDPTPLIEAGDVVVVSMNYRLGPFGFLAHPALDAEDHPAVNYGVMDQQLALKWVRDNIARFGGDPNNVTIFGLSAGGLNVTTHLISPLSADLFHRAIIQSGSYQLDTPSLEEAEALGVAFAERAGCKDQSAACLRALPADTIVANAGVLTRPDSAVHQSIVDGKILPEDQRGAIEAGRIHRVPVLLGSTSDEQAVFGCGALDAMKSFSKWAPTYAYEFADPKAHEQGAVHGSDQKYLLIGLQDSPVTGGGPADMSTASQRVSQAMRLTWVTFAATGKPHTWLIPSWPMAPNGIQRFEPSLPATITPAAMSARLKCESLRERNILPREAGKD